MRWGVFTVALLAVYFLQTSVFWTWGVRWLDAFLVMALLCALLGRTHDARIAGWLIGLVQDIGTPDAFGIHALVLGLSALFVTKMRGWINTRIWWPRMLLLFAAALPGQLLYALHLRYWSWVGIESRSLLSIVFEALALSIIAAAVAALLTMLPWFMTARQRRIRSMRRI